MVQGAAQVSFEDLVLGFSSAALYYMGYAHVEGKAVSEKNKTLAAQNISCLELLQQKTQGNLSAEESSMLISIINDLRQKFINTFR